ncbi:MAG TPA: AAA family ATPase [Solirubrobacteraceae bacterium]|nr:AAA family ATPase [Solirubrobacteraceae bacterium]
MGERTRIQLCGRLSVELDGVELVQSLRGKQVPLLLAYLVLNRDRPVGREELIGALWPETAPRSQDAAMRTLLSRLRSALGRDIVAGRDELGLALPEPAWVDVEAAASEVWRAQRALDSGDARAAWALAQVPLNIASRGLLPGTQASWLEPRRQELADIRLQALEVIGRAGLNLGGTQLGSVERAARTLIESEPYRESGYVLLMAALEAQGNVAEGLRVFEQLRSLLRDELGIAPSPEAIQAHERLLNPPAARQSLTTAATAAEIEVPAELAAAASAALVGRQTEMEQLEAWWQAPPDRERVMLLAGDPGIGKTRLLAATAVRAFASGAIVLAGRAPEETLVPYQPFLEALGHYVLRAPLEELRVVAREYGAELGRLIPALRRRVPELPPPDPGDPETDRYRLFEAVAGLLAEISAAVPVLIVLDDLQWADRPTLLLLRHLARSPHNTRVSIMGAYRDVDQWSEGFDAALAGLRRERLMVQLDVGGLPEAEAMELVRLRAGGTPSLAFVQALYRETEGNPFFIEEIVRHLTDAGLRSQDAGARDLERVGLPEDVRDVISRRLDRLAPGSIEWLRVAAVIGRDFDSGLLERVLGFDEDRFLSALEDALDAGLVAEAPGDPGRYSFAHALIRETLYEGMSSARRARVHRRVGVALEESDPALPESQIGALALHFTRAADPEDAERAIRYGLRAGEQATAMLANEEAAAHYSRALEVLDRSDPEALRRRCDLLLELGEAQVRSGERPLAWATLREAAALAAELGDKGSLARAAIGASRRYVQPPGVVDEELIALLEQGAEMTANERTVTRVRLLARLCGALYFSDRRDRMTALSAEATAIAAELEDPQAIALAAAARRRAYWGPGELQRRLADSTLLLRAAREASDTELTLQGHAWLVVDLLERGDRTGVEVQIDAFTAGADQLRQPLYLWNAAVWQAMRALLDGRLEEAEPLAAAAVSSGIRSEGVTAPQYYAVQVLYLRREQARMGELEDPVREALSTNPDRAAWRAGLALMLHETGRTEEARAEFDLLARDGFSRIPRDGDWMVVTALAADLAHALDDAERAAILYALLAPFADTNVVIGLGAVCLGSTSRYLGRLALTLGRQEEAVAHLRRAVAANASLQAVVELAHSWVDLAWAVGPGGEAVELLQQAEAVATERRLPAVARRAALLRERFI